MATSVKHPPRGRAEITDAVLDAAERLFAESGPGGASLRDIADEAEVTYSLINRHFGTKEALFIELLDRYATHWGERMSDETPLVDRLETLLGTTGAQGPYLRLLAWSLLRGDVTDHAERSVLDQLLPEPASDGDRSEVAAALALVFGWRFFGAFITAALHIDDDATAETHSYVKSKLRGLLA